MSMEKLFGATAIAVMCCSVGQIVTMAFGLWRLDAIAADVKETADESSERVASEIRNFRADIQRAGWVR